MAYNVYLGSMLCPIAPSKIETKIKGRNKTLTLINDGEVNILKDPGLTEITFDLLLPNVKYPFAKYKNNVWKNAKGYLDILEELKLNKSVFPFIVTRTLPSGKILFDTNISVSLENYTIKEDAKQGFDILVSITLKQYKHYGTKIVNVSADGTASVENVRETSNAPDQNTTYGVLKGDTTWNIAKKLYGDGSLYPAVYAVNKDDMENLNTPIVGRELKILQMSAAKAEVQQVKNVVRKSRVTITPSTGKTKCVILGLVNYDDRISYLSGDYITSDDFANDVITTTVKTGTTMMLKIERRDRESKNKILIGVTHDGQQIYKGYITDTKNSVEVQLVINKAEYNILVSAIEYNK